MFFCGIITLMKILFTISILITFLFASTQQNYENFNLALDKLSKTLSVEQRTMLYLLGLSTQKNITASKSFEEQKEQVLIYISELKKVQKISQKDVQKLEDCYLDMVEPTRKVVFLDEFYVILVFIGLILGFFLGYLKFKTNGSQKDIQHIVLQDGDKDKKIIRDLQDLNNKLKKEINILKLEI